MDELEFRQRLYSNPSEPDEGLLTAAKVDSALQNILDETQEFESELDQTLLSTEIPEGLAEKLLAIPSSEEPAATSSAVSEEILVRPAANGRLFQYYAIAACLLLALGVTFSGSFLPSSSTIEVALGEDVLFHLYEDNEEIAAINSGELLTSIAATEINDVMSESGSHLSGSEFLVDMPVRSAKPCVIQPSYESAHLLVSGDQGAVSVIVINSTPVAAEYAFRDDRFSGIILPMGEGNIILVGEQNEDLSHYKTLFSNNVEWVI